MPRTNDESYKKIESIFATDEQVDSTTTRAIDYTHPRSVPRFLSAQERQQEDSRGLAATKLIIRRCPAEFRRAGIRTSSRDYFVWLFLRGQPLNSFPLGSAHRFAKTWPASPREFVSRRRNSTLIFARELDELRPIVVRGFDLISSRDSSGITREIFLRN